MHRYSPDAFPHVSAEARSVYNSVPCPSPEYQEFMRPLLDAVRDGQEQNVRQAYSTAADRLRLTEADRQELNPSGTQRLLDNRAGWARTYLLKAGLLESPRRAFIGITSRGRQAP